jgi:tRNA-binding EMAP/Myf-like protein
VALLYAHVWHLKINSLRADMYMNSSGAVAGLVHTVATHPNGQLIWLAYVDIGNTANPVQIIFGGQYLVQPGELVPVAPPGAQVVVVDGRRTRRVRRMRSRQFRGLRSHGMLCSLDELGWLEGGPDEVAILRGLRPGDPLDDIPVELRPVYVERPRVA